jgi:hypothetical protein
MKEYYQKPEVKKRMKEYSRALSKLKQKHEKEFKEILTIKNENKSEHQ